jgi:hypothetical protein
MFSSNGVWCIWSAFAARLRRALKQDELFSITEAPRFQSKTFSVTEAVSFQKQDLSASSIGRKTLAVEAEVKIESIRIPEVR